MDDSNPSEAPTQQLKLSEAMTKEMHGVLSHDAAPDEQEALRLGRIKVLEMIAADAPLKEILTKLVLLIEAQLPEMLCSILLLSDDGNHIKHGAAPSLPERYIKAVDGAPIGPKHGSCGTAMYRGEPVVVSDILTDPLWEDYRDIAAASGLRACWSTPIMSGRGKVLGSFAMYYREPRTPTGDEAKLTEVATRIAGLAIEHHSARESLVRTRAELAKANQTATIGEIASALLGEINHPLEAIVNNADRCLKLLKDPSAGEGKPDDATVREAMTKIAADARRALAIIARLRVLENRHD
jgi:GAF domain-containing protein